MKTLFLGLAMIACVGIAAPALAELNPDKPDQHASITNADVDSTPMSSVHRDAGIELPSADVVTIAYEVILDEPVTLIVVHEHAAAWPNFGGSSQPMIFDTVYVDTRDIMRASARSTTVFIC